MTLLFILNLDYAWGEGATPAAITHASAMWTTEPKKADWQTLPVLADWTPERSKADWVVLPSRTP